MRKRVNSALITACLVTAAFAAQVEGADKRVPAPAGDQAAIQREVRHEIVSLSRYGVFDNIGYRVDGTRVTLMGQVVQPVLKDDAQAAVKGIAGVTEVNNQIEVLPLSPMDNGVRRAVYRAIYSSPDLSRYAFQAVPSIHIIVKNGNVTLVGAVANEMDKSVASLRANTVSGVFSVTNNLQVDSDIG